MKKSYYAALAAAMMLTIPGGVVQASEQTHELEEVVVTGEKDKNILQGGYVSTEGNVGLLGDKDTMEVPFSVTNFTAKTLETFGGPDKPQDQMFISSPSVRATGSIVHGDFYFRGFRTNGTNYYVNGVPGVLTQFNTPTHIFESIDLISGANVGLFGTGVNYETTNPGGVVNATTKKAPEEGVLTYTQTISGRGLFGEYIDWGQRFGKDKEWGIRILTENVNGKTSVKGTEINAQSIYANIDHRSEHTKDNLFFGYRNFDLKGGIRWFMLNQAEIPAVPNGSNDYGYEGMIKATNGWFAVYNHEQKFNDHWDGFFNFGVQDNDLDKNVMANGGSGYYLNADGTFDVTSKPGATPQTYWYWQAGTTAHYNTGAVKHDITLSYNQAQRNRKSAYDNGSVDIIGQGSLYDGITMTGTPRTHYLTRRNNRTRVKSLSLVDSMTYDKWNFLLGIHKHEVRAQSYSWNKDNSLKGIDTTNSDATSPTYGIVYRPNDEISIYGSHSENFDSGYGVNTVYENFGDVLPPAKTKQNEIGIKYKKNNLLWTLAYYDIKQANNIGVKVDGYSKEFLRQDGEARHKGFELGVNGKLSDKWSIFGGLSHMSAKYEKTAGGKLDGVRENGSTEWTAVLGLQYDPSEDWSIMGRMAYTGESPMFNEAVYAPGYVVWDLGVSHKTKIGNIPTTLSLMCYNLFDKDYWMVSRGNWVYLSTPRTVTFTAQFSF